MKVRVLLVSSVLASLGVLACSSDSGDSAQAPVDPNANIDGAVPPSNVPSSEADASVSSDAAVADAADPLEQDAGLITDGGGGNPDEDPDGGLIVVFPDASADAGACGPAAGNGAEITSACSASNVLALGGQITPGTYDLAGFTVTGTLAYCSTYLPGKYEGRLDIESDGKGGFVLRERTLRTNLGKVLPVNRTFNATVSGNALAVSQTCGIAVKSSSFGYSTGTFNGKPAITYTHDSGSATVRYRWVLR